MAALLLDGSIVWPIALFLSLMVGSFLNVVILRLPQMMEREWEAEFAEHQSETDLVSLASEAIGLTVELERFNLAAPASRCNQCGHKIRWYENVPVVSWLVLRGKCSNCQTAISPRYPLIEALTGLVGGYIGYRFGLGIEGLALLGFSYALIALTFIDIDHHLLPDRITLPLLWLGLLVNSQESFTALSSAVWGAALGYLALWSVYWAFKLLTGKEGMGYGDFKLLAAIGAWGGVAVLPLTILLSSVVGVVLTLLLSVIGKREASQPLPFGPYLAIAGWIALLWSEGINAWYLGLLL